MPLHMLVVTREQGILCVPRLSVRMPDSQSRKPALEFPLLPFRSLSIFVLSTTPQFSCVNDYLAVDGGGNMSE